MARPAGLREKPPSAQSAERALALLDVLAGHGGRLHLSDLAHAADLNISTTWRLVGALERAGLVDRDPETGRYRLGFKLLWLAQVVLEQTPLPELANPILARLMEATGETATLYVLHDDAVIIVARAECTSPLRAVAQVGHQGPLYCTAHGKAMLAWMPDGAVRDILARGMPLRTELTIATAEAMAEDLDRIRERGYAIDLGEREPGLASIAAPVRDASGHVAATCGVSGSRQRMPDDVLPTLAAHVLDAAGTLSARLGGIAPRAPAAPRFAGANGVGGRHTERGLGT